MTNHQHKTSVQVSIHSTLEQDVMQKILDGVLKPGDRIASERDLAQSWGISRGTARVALQSLEKQGFLERRGNLGTIVRNAGSRVAKVVLAFPEESITLDRLSPECWAISSELYRGMLYEAALRGIQVIFEHFCETSDRSLLEAQLGRLMEYDAAVFASGQLMALQESIAQMRPVFRLHGVEAEPLSGIVNIDYDRQGALDCLVSHLVERGCRRAGVISFASPGASNAAFYRKRGEDFLACARMAGMEAPEEGNYVVDLSKNRESQLDCILSENFPRAFFCNNIDCVSDMYEAAARHKLAIGQDILLVSIATGMTLQGFFPSFTYVRVPLFELGRAVIKRLACDSGNRECISAAFQLVTGQSTAGKKQ